MSVRPRNTLVLVKLVQQSQRLIGAIVKPTGGEEFAEATVIAIGPGSGSVAGSNSETFDLFPGQRVLLLAKQPGPGGTMKLACIPVEGPDGTYHLYEQARILAIVSEPAN
jgi:co-chaperonin GroES (HSP10)